jgi:hypothetical protein
MVSVDDIVRRIAQDLSINTGINAPAAAIAAGGVFDMHIAITTDLEETELDYIKRYGYGHTFSFKLFDYEHGKNLARQLYYKVLGVQPNMDGHTGAKFAAGDKLHLFVHLRGVEALFMNVPAGGVA